MNVIQLIEEGNISTVKKLYGYDDDKVGDVVALQEIALKAKMSAHGDSSSVNMRIYYEVKDWFDVHGHDITPLIDITHLNSKTVQPLFSKSDSDTSSIMFVQRTWTGG